jgi:hypothetical protein
VQLKKASPVIVGGTCQLTPGSSSCAPAFSQKLLDGRLHASVYSHLHGRRGHIGIREQSMCHRRLLVAEAHDVAPVSTLWNSSNPASPWTWQRRQARRRFSLGRSVRQPAWWRLNPGPRPISARGGSIWRCSLFKVQPPWWVQIFPARRRQHP